MKNIIQVKIFMITMITIQIKIHNTIKITNIENKGLLQIQIITKIIFLSIYIIQIFINNHKINKDIDKIKKKVDKIQ
jgi:hypothetical protein